MSRILWAAKSETKLRLRLCMIAGLWHDLSDKWQRLAFYYLAENED